MKTRDFRDLVVWQRAMLLTHASYAIARRLPAEERFALAGQIRRAAASVPASIADGHARQHRGEFLQFLAISHASLEELESHLLLCEHVGYTHPDVVANALAISDEVSRMLRAMRRSLSAPHPPRSTLDAPRSRRQHTERRNRSQS